MTRAAKWHASERISVEPFPTSDSSLARVRLRLTRNDDPRADLIHYVDTRPLPSDAQPELFLAVDTATLASEVGAPVDDLRISVVLRDRIVHWFECIRTWPLTDLPDDGWPITPLVGRLTPNCRFDIAVVATLRTSVNDVPDNTVLARKVFSVKPQPQLLDDLVRPVSPDQMASEGLPRSTVCYVKWKGEDITAVPSDLLEVWINQDFEDKFQELSAPSASAAALQISRAIAADVYREILAQVLQGDEESDDAGALVSLVEGLFVSKLRTPLADARVTYRSGPEGRAKLTPWCWRLVRTDTAFAGLTL